MEVARIPDTGKPYLYLYTENVATPPAMNNPFKVLQVIQILQYLLPNLGELQKFEFNLFMKTLSSLKAMDSEFSCTLVEKLTE